MRNSKSVKINLPDVNSVQRTVQLDLTRFAIFNFVIIKPIQAVIIKPTFLCMYKLAIGVIAS